jgi:nitronate monooxygenase
MELPKIIQGGMGVAISHWGLAKTVSKLGQFGIMSGTGMGLILSARLSDGDKDGNMRRAMSHFPMQDAVQRILDKYYVPEGRGDDGSYRRPPMWTINPSKSLLELTVVGNFVEVFLAKEGHDNPVGINLLEKLQLPNISSLYGAMLADVDLAIMGAGIPFEIPGALDNFVNHQAASYRIDVLDNQDQDYTHVFDPEEIFPGIGDVVGPLKRPMFFPIISSLVLGKALLKRSTGKINGFIVEAASAAGHNAPPRGPMQLNEIGEPIYGKKDVIDIAKIAKLGLPFYLASGYDSPEGLQEALALGANGIQVGTAFAYCSDSGMEPNAREKGIQKILDEEASVYTDPLFSPTGFPFKLAQIDGTLSDSSLVEARQRVCDIGYLRDLYVREKDGKMGYRCPAEPVKDYVRKGGQIEDTVGRACLCNALGAAAGYSQYRKKLDYTELPAITSGDTLPSLGRYIPAGQKTFTAKDVIEYLLGERG